MKKIPKFLLLASLALLTSASSCDKKVKPALEQIDSCKECGGAFERKLTNEIATLNFNKGTNEWIIGNNKFSAFLPCKFPNELIIENKEISFTGKISDSPYYGVVSSIICIEKIY
jgi:hypothetical protein